MAEVFTYQHFHLFDFFDSLCLFCFIFTVRVSFGVFHMYDSQDPNVDIVFEPVPGFSLPVDPAMAYQSCLRGNDITSATAARDCVTGANCNGMLMNACLLP